MKEISMMHVAFLRVLYYLIVIATVLCSACVQHSSEMYVGPRHSVNISGASLPELKSGMCNDSHPVSLAVSDKALADDVYFAFSLLLRRGVWRNVRLVLSEGESMGMCYGTIDDYKPEPGEERCTNIKVRCNKEYECKTMIFHQGDISNEYSADNVCKLYDQIERLGGLWTMEVCCCSDYPFRDVIDLCQVAVRNGCKQLYFVTVLK